jgi:hypothetical protein
MAKVVITSTQECTIDGIGLLIPGQDRELNELDLVQFKAIHGYEISKAQFPNFVRLEVRV